MAGTQYTVFRKNGAGFEVLKSGVEASTPRGAIAEVADEDGEYAATPTRSWVTLPVVFEKRAKIG